MPEVQEVPLSFRLHLNGREEAIKVVEPQMDVPLPEDARLVVDKADPMRNLHGAKSGWILKTFNNT